LNKIRTVNKLMQYLYRWNEPTTKQLNRMETFEICKKSVMTSIYNGVYNSSEHYAQTFDDLVQILKAYHNNHSDDTLQNFYDGIL
jgi:hypothetical protein